jgi:hypothetical protein
VRIFFISIIFFLLTNCVQNKRTFWCGDHPCINKAERKAYFQKTMIVEVKDFKKDKNINNNDLEKLMQEAGKKEKSRIRKEKNQKKQFKYENKKKVKEQRRLDKIAKKKEKENKKKEKKLAKKIDKDLKKELKKRVKLTKEVQSDAVIINKNKKHNTKKTNNINNSQLNYSSNFKDLVNKVVQRNSLKPYPNINVIPD